MLGLLFDFQFPQSSAESSGYSSLQNVHRSHWLSNYADKSDATHDNVIAWRRTKTFSMSLFMLTEIVKGKHCLTIKT